MQPDPQASGHALSGRSSRDLLEDIRWLRRLAAALVGNSGADDVVQETFEVALSRTEPVRDLRPFLAGVARRISRRVLRGERRRQRREHRVGLAEECPTTDELCERVDLARVVLEELRELPPTRQRVVMLRYLEGLEPTEIARLEGAQPATVRANLSRGLSELRQRLDRRSGSRAAWCMVLIPWLEANPGLRTGVASATSANLVGGFALMTSTALGKLSLVLVPSLVALALWKGPWLAPLSPTGESVPIEVATLDTPAPATSTVDSAPVSRTSLEVSPPSTPTQAASVAPVRAVRLVDAVTAEAVPELTLIIEGDEEFAVTSDTEGNATVPELPERTSVILSEEVRDRGYATRSARRRVDWPLPAEVEVHVGPTFRFAGELPAGVELAALEAVFEERAAHDMEQRASLRPAEAGYPWVRFPFAVTTLAGQGPWNLHVTDQEGHWRAHAAVTRKAGVEPLPVPLVFEGFGAARFTVDRDAGPIAQLISLELESLATGEIRRVPMIDREDGPTLRGHAGLLEPGRYVWHMNGRSETIDIELARTTHVELGPEVVSPEETFDALVRLDLSVGTDVDPASMRVFVVKADELDRGFATHPVPDPAGPEGSWLVELEDLTRGEWFVSPAFAGEGRRFEPEFASVVPDGEVPLLELVDLGETVMVTVRVVDEYGAPLQGAEVAHDAGDFTRTYLNPDGRGGLMRAGMPESTRNRLHVRAPGHRYRMLFHRPDEDGHELEVALQPGWSNVVTVLDLATQAPVPGARVLVNGREVGVTGDAGSLMIEGEGRPESIEIISPGREVVAGGLEQEGIPEDPLGGWVFLTRWE